MRYASRDWRRFVLTVVSGRPAKLIRMAPKKLIRMVTDYSSLRRLAVSSRRSRYQQTGLSPIRKQSTWTYRRRLGLWQVRRTVPAAATARRRFRRRQQVFEHLEPQRCKPAPVLNWHLRLAHQRRAIPFLVGDRYV